MSRIHRPPTTPEGEVHMAGNEMKKRIGGLLRGTMPAAPATTVTARYFTTGVTFHD